MLALADAPVVDVPQLGPLVLRVPLPVLVAEREDALLGSRARDVATVIGEIQATRVTERGETRADDRTSEAAMEDRKREGYF